MSGTGLRVLTTADPARVGPYRLLARLGAGGMGQVYLGRSQGRRLVAVKLVHPHFADNAVFRRRFTKEIAAASRITGFYTAQVIDADADADPPWLATEYIAGPSLQDAVEENGALPEIPVAALGAGLAEGLRAVHAQNVIHRDLKPGNVLLAQDGPRIIDFGIARAMDAPTQSLTLMGTPGYMSPEQYLGGDLEPASDVFCLAAVLTFAATGRHPFGEGPAEALGYRVRHQNPDLTDVPASLRPLIAAGLEKNPGDRPATEDFLDRCSALVADEGMALPETFTTMIAKRVAQTEVFTGKAGTDDHGARPPRDEGERPPAARPQPLPRPVRRKRPPARPAAAVMAGVVGVVLVALLIAVVGNRDSEGSNNDDAASTSAASRSTGRAGDGGSTRPSPTPDRTWKAFDDTSVNDCLDASGDPWNPGGWLGDMPRAVSCGESDAYLRVTGVGKTSSACDSKPLDGESYWESPTYDGGRIYLCVERQFRDGECFLGKKGRKTGSAAISGYGLMTSWRCNKSDLPREYSYVLQYTGYYKSRCPRGSMTWDFRQGVLCARIVKAKGPAAREE
ncbi:serine/threonine-protein kinase [Actinomadura mexicana]|uniref:Protein kinase domain-containing protein n=1 Tax=Actinomadura mexicana TaxID=134959 RepID=A0A239BYA6_9ACTN|nr:serine/threonine-protein kinase [Actinomadura mexicana]SNS12408.1 Protein kinase domain-containing protein [Actinomadura mexicana]